MQDFKFDIENNDTVFDTDMVIIDSCRKDTKQLRIERIISCKLSYSDYFCVYIEDLKLGIRNTNL